MNTTNLEKNKKPVPKDGDGDDIPFVLCTPTKIGAIEDQGITNGEDDVEPPSKLMSFYLMPRPSCHYTGCHPSSDDAGPTADEMLGENNMITDSAEDESLDRNSLHLSPRGSPVPPSHSFDVIVPPPVVINLLKRRRRASQEEQQEGDDGMSSLMTNGPLFPILGRRDDHLRQQQQQQRPVIILRPIARRFR
jgi:hypothetical protein